MSDNMDGYLSSEIAKVNSSSNGGMHQLRNIALRNANIEQLKSLNDKSSYIIALENEVSILNIELDDVKAKLKDTQQKLSEQIQNTEESESVHALITSPLGVKLVEATMEAAFYKNLLSKPMYEIAAKNNSFRETYDKQREMMAEWMVSQRAFKELAIQFAFDAGKSKEEVLSLKEPTELKVLNNETEHGNNLGEHDSIRPYAANLKSKIEAKINKLS